MRLALPLLAVASIVACSSGHPASLGDEGERAGDGGVDAASERADADVPDADPGDAGWSDPGCDVGSPPHVPQGTLRIAVVGPKGWAASSIASFLQAMLAADGRWTAPTVTAVESDTPLGGESLVGFRFSPDGRDARLAPLAGPLSHVVMLDPPPFAVGYPELHFAGVREVACLARKAGAKPVLAMSWSGDAAETATRGEVAYRVGNGTGSAVAPVGYAWDALAASASPRPAQAYAMVAAATLYAAIAGKSPAEVGWQPSGADAAMVAAIGAAAIDAVRSEAKRAHYATPWAGVVAVAPWSPTGTLRFMDSGTSSEAIWEGRMNEIVPRIGEAADATAIGACNDSKTFDATCLANAVPHFQWAQYAILFARDYAVDAAAIRAAGGQTDLQVQVWDRHPDGAPVDGLAVIGLLEANAKAKYDQAKRLGLAWIPHHLAFARLNALAPSIALTTDGTHVTPPVGWALATMSVVSRTGMTPSSDGLDADTTLAARVGVETVRQLASLSTTGAYVPDDPATRPSLP